MSILLQMQTLSQLMPTNTFLKVALGSRGNMQWIIALGNGLRLRYSPLLVQIPIESSTKIII